MKRLVYIAAVVLVSSACSSDQTPETTVAENTEVKPEVAAVVPNRVLTMEIDGMACEMNCGGSIRKELKSTGGVSDVSFDFENDRATNVATISFDKSIVTADEMVKAISELNNGQFTIGAISSSSLDKEISTDENSTSSSEGTNVEVSTSQAEMPNLLDLLSGLLFE